MQERTLAAGSTPVKLSCLKAKPSRVSLLSAEILRPVVPVLRTIIVGVTDSEGMKRTVHECGSATGTCHPRIHCGGDIFTQRRARVSSLSNALLHRSSVEARVRKIIVVRHVFAVKPPG